MTSEQVLDELELLAAVEHALIVEYLSVCCALGHDLGPDEGGATTDQGHDAAAAGFNLAMREMYHFKGINLALVDAGRSAQMERAAGVSSDSVAEVALGPPSQAELERLVEREEAIASALDERYKRLQPAVTSDPVFDGALLDNLRAVIVDDGPTHAEMVATLLDPLSGLAPANLLRATRREGRDAFERRLLGVSDRAYGLVLAGLEGWFSQPGAGGLRDLAVSAMEGLDEINRALVQRGLLPPFTRLT